MREKSWDQVHEALLLYCMPGTPVHNGLLCRRDAEADIWRQGITAQPVATMATAPARAAVAVAAREAHPSPLPVAYFDQMLIDDGQGWRDCFTASCAMLACYWDKLKDANAYDDLRQ